MKTAATKKKATNARTATKQELAETSARHERTTLAKPAASKAIAKPTAGFRLLNLPALGAYWPGQGGIFVTLMADENGREYALIKAEKHFDSLNHADATAKAAALQIDGHNDFTLPNRREGRVLFACAKKFFEAAWYWLSEPYAGGSSSAWYQSFSYGGQYFYPKDLKLRGCAVRRAYLPI
jgi:hypothetical protein